MKNLVSLILTITLSLSLMSMNLNAQDSDWKLYKEINGIQIYQMEKECHDEANGLHQEFILLKCVNTTSNDMELSWTLEAWYDGECTTCHDPDNPEYQFSVKVNAGESVRGSCDIREGKTLKIFKGFLNKEGTSTLTKFELKNLSAKPL